MKRNNIYIALITLFFVYSCKPDIDRITPTSGDADFTNFVAIGNSLTSGYADGGLSYGSQQTSFAVMMAEQIALVGGTNAFKIPYLSETGNGNNGSNETQKKLGYATDCLGNTSLSTVNKPSPVTALNNVSANGPYNLIGVPGARATDAVFGLYSALNPFLTRYCQTPGLSTMLSEALRANPSFFSLWLGNNDVLGYATGGGIDANSIFSGITPPASLEGALTLMVDSFTKRSAKGVIANVPDVTALPFFTTVPYNGAVIDQATADNLNALYASLGLSHITWKAGNNPFVIVDSSVANPNFVIRQATPGDLILLTLPLDSVKCAGWGINPTKPLGDAYVLDSAEVRLVQSTISQYNVIIKNIASKYSLAYCDMNAYMNTFKSGIVYNGIAMNAEYVSGGAFSLDGIHPNPRGYALIANEFIRVINGKYRSSIPAKDATMYPGIIFP